MELNFTNTIKKAVKIAVIVALGMLVHQRAQSQCNYSLLLYDSFGDGWNTSTLEVTYGSTIDTITLGSGGFAQLDLLVATGDTIILNFLGGGGFDDEIHFQLNDFYGDSLYYADSATIGLHYSTSATCPTCVPPMDPVVNINTADTLELAWTEMGSATEWQIEYGTAGFTQGNGNYLTATSNPFLFPVDSLMSLTDYEFYVRSVCTPGDSSFWTTAGTFTSACGTFNAPWIDSVEEHTPTTSLTDSRCWTATGTGSYSWDIIDDGTTPSGSTGPTGAASGVQYFFTEATGASAGDSALLTSPLIDISALAEPSLQFDYHMYGSTMGNLIIEIYDTDTGIWSTVFQLEGEQQTAAADPWIHHAINLASFTGPVMVRFTGIRGSSFYSDICIDNITFDEGPSCYNPAGLEVDNITNKTAEAIWTENGSATLWELQYDTVGFPVGTGNSIITGSNPNNISGLDANTTYELYVRAVCGTNDSSGWIGPVMFTTECDVAMAPWVDSVESQLGTTSFTDYLCWSSPQTSGFTWDVTDDGTTPSTSTGAEVAYSGSNFFYTEGSSGGTGDTADLYTPEVNINALTYPSLQFYYHMFGDDYDALYIDIFDGAVWHLNVDSLVGSYQALQDDPWLLKIVNLSGFSGTIQARFRAIRGPGFESDYCIDDIAFVDGPSCYSPYNVTATNITTDSALVNWLFTDSSSTWQLSYGLTGFDPDTGMMATVSGATSYQLSGLMANSSYDVYVRLVCAPGDTSNWSMPGTFVTECSFYSPPFIETFNTNSTSKRCWSVLNNNGDGDEWNTSYTLNEFEGDGVAAMYTDFNSGNNDDYLITPQIKLTGNERLKFNYRARSSSEPNDYQVLISTAGSDSASFTDTLLVDTANSTTYAEHVIDLSAYSGDVFIAWHIPPGSLDGWYLYIDYVVIEEIPTCFIPTNLAVVDSLIELDSAYITWTENGTATEWEVEYGLSGYTLGTGTSVIATDTNVWLSGLMHSTAYDVYVRAICGAGDTSLWASTNQTFTTLCGPISAPYIDSVESHTPTTALTTSNCWTAVNVSSTFSWDITDDGTTPSSTTGASEAASGLQYFHTEATSGGTGDTADLYSPEIILNPLTAPSLQFDYHMHGSNMGTLIVDIFDGSVWVTDFYVIDGEQQSDELDDWKHAILNLSSFTDTIQIRFRGIRGDGYRSDICVDNIEVVEGPSCYDPIALEVDNITSSEATLNWAVVDGAGEWFVVYDTAGFNPDSVSGGVSAFSKPFGLSGLTESTTYEAYVRSVCGPGDSSGWLGPVSFTTLCAPFPVPFVEGFNSNSMTEGCWTILNVNGDGDDWNTNYTTNELEGDEVAMMYTDFNSGNNDDYLITPQITLTGNQRLRYYYRAASTSEPNDYEVLVSTSSLATTAFIDTLLVDTVSSTTYLEQILDLSAYSGETYIAFHIPSGGLDGWRLYIDSVVIEEIPSCPVPSGLTAMALSDSSIVVDWVENGTAKDWEIQYDTTGFSLGNGISTIVGSFPDTISGLTSDTEYEFYVRSVCGAGDSSVFTTSAMARTFCVIASAPFIDSVESHTATTSLDVSQCWSTTSTGTYTWDVSGSGTTPTSSTGPSSANSGSKFFFTEGSSGSTGDTAVLYSPQVDITGLPLPSLQFYYHMYGSSITALYVQLYDTSWHTVDSIIGQQQGSSGTNWYQRIIDLTGYSGVLQARFIGIKGSGIYGDICLDDIAFTKGPSCYPPSNLTVDEIGADSVVLSWIEPDSATQWIIEYDSIGFTQGTGTYIVANSIPFTVTGLNSNYDYDFYVMSYCGVGDSSSVIGPAYARTLCAPYVAPWTEPFTNEVVPDCWSTGGATSWEFGSGATGGFADYGANDVLDHTPGGGTSFIGMDGSDNSSGEVSTLSTPLVDVSGLTYPSFSYAIFSNNIDDAALNEVLVEIYDGTNWILLDSIKANLDTTWVVFEHDLSSLNITGTTQVRFTITGSSTGSSYYNDILIDDVTFDELYSCFATDIVTSDATENSVTLTWTENGSATTWDVIYGPVGFTPGSGGTVVSGVTTPAVITGLTEDTGYDFYLIGNCSEGDTSLYEGPASDTTLPKIDGIASSLGTIANMYPNPARDLVNVEFSTMESGRIIDVISITGKQLISMDAERKVIALETKELPSGVYTVRVTSNAGTAYQKLVIKR